MRWQLWVNGENFRNRKKQRFTVQPLGAKLAQLRSGGFEQARAHGLLGSH